MRQAVSHTPQRRSFATDTSKELPWVAKHLQAVEMPIQSSRGPEREHEFPMSLPSRKCRCPVAEYFPDKMRYPTWPRMTTNPLVCSNPRTAVPEPESPLTDGALGHESRMLRAQSRRSSDAAGNTTQSILD